MCPELMKRPERLAAVLEELEKQLNAIHAVVPKARVGRLKEMPIWVEWDQPGAKSAAQFHVSAGWLRANGYNPEKVDCVEISHVGRFLAWSRTQPWMVMHELAHAYHHRVLTYEHAGVKAAYENYFGKPFENTPTELVSHTVRLRPWRIDSQLAFDPFNVVLLDCDGTAANSLFKHPDPITLTFAQETVQYLLDGR